MSIRAAEPNVFARTFDPDVIDRPSSYEVASTAGV
jgi:hypothetical protein